MMQWQSCFCNHQGVGQLLALFDLCFYVSDKALCFMSRSMEGDSYTLSQCQVWSGDVACWQGSVSKRVLNSKKAVCPLWTAVTSLYVSTNCQHPI